MLVRGFRQVSRFTGIVLLPLVREAESRGLASAHDAPDARAWLRDSLNVRPAEAGRLLRLARALDGDLPETATALADGAVSVDHAQTIAEAMRALPAETPADVRTAAEHELVERSGTVNPDEVALLGRRVLDVVDPDGSAELQARQAEREAAAAYARRDLRICPAGPGLRRVTGFLDTEGAETLRVALDPLAAPRPADPDTGVRDDRTHGQRMADALVELANRSLRMGDLPDNGGERPTLVVTMPYASWSPPPAWESSTAVTSCPPARCGASPATPTSSPPSSAGRACRWTSAGAPGTTSARPAARLFSATAGVFSPPATAPTSGATAITASTGPTAAEPTRTTACSYADITIESSTTTAGTYE